MRQPRDARRRSVPGLPAVILALAVVGCARPDAGAGAGADSGVRAAALAADVRARLDAQTAHYPRPPLRGAPRSGRAVDAYRRAVDALERDAEAAEVTALLADGALAADGGSPFTLLDPETPSPRAGWLRLGRIAAEEASRKAKSGDVEGAVDGLLDGLQLAADYTRGGAFFGRVAAAVVGNPVCRAARELAPGLPPAALSRLEAAVLALVIPPLGDAVRDEALGTEVMLARVFAPEFAPPPGASEFDAATAHDLLALPWPLAEVVWIEYRALMAEVAKVADQPGSVVPEASALIERGGRFSPIFSGSDVVSNLRRSLVFTDQLALLAKDLAGHRLGR